ncbi:hypothetical protein SKAU_G00090550 [Synaphobranchus kaupii]|uniref:G-protein coupled receptors family 1 profile domain-containing protein n=1 Tax=Synaphobranchus kaupii TaxID=118154 RepID=A0A9Q1FWR1_SYNKA|nr:hypothetical protein SKAU_G00090550 [Synaphobranchus kaupii]
MPPLPQMDPLRNRSWDVSTAPQEGCPSTTATPSLCFPGMQLLLSFKPLFVPLYCLLVAVACVGNASLLACILADKKLYNATNFFIGNLAAGDLLMCLSCVPLTASYAFDPRGWSLRTPPLLPGAPAAGRHRLRLGALVTAIAADRYVVVAHPIRRRISPAVLRPSGLELVVCEEFWPGTGRLRMLYSCFMLLASYMVPLLSVSVSYCAITAHLRQRCLPGAPTRSQQSWNKKRRKTFSLLVASVLAFALCWLPLQALNLLLDLDGEFRIVGKRYVNVLQVCCHLVAMSSACYNPFIYASLHNKLRLHLRGGCGPAGNRAAWSRSTPPATMPPASAWCPEPPGKEGRDVSQTRMDNFL